MKRRAKYYSDLLPHIRRKIIQNEVKSFKEFGYPFITRDNILTDKVYSKLFKSQLEKSAALLPEGEVEIWNITQDLLHEIEVNGLSVGDKVLRRKSESDSPDKWRETVVNDTYLNLIKENPFDYKTKEDEE